MFRNLFGRIESSGLSTSKLFGFATFGLLLAQSFGVVPDGLAEQVAKAATAAGAYGTVVGLRNGLSRGVIEQRAAAIEQAAEAAREAADSVADLFIDDEEDEG